MCSHNSRTGKGKEKLFSREKEQEENKTAFFLSSSFCCIVRRVLDPTCASQGDAVEEVTETGFVTHRRSSSGDETICLQLKSD